MRGSLTAGLVSYLGLLAMTWSNVAVLAVPAPQRVAQGTTITGINRPTLRVGSQGVAVSELQAALKLLGYYTGVVDGVYRESTVIAVSRFQEAAGLNPDGVVSQDTWQLLFPPSAARASVPSTSAANSAATFPVPSATSTNGTDANASGTDANDGNNQPTATSTPRPRQATVNSEINTTSSNNPKPTTTAPARSRRLTTTRSTTSSITSPRPATTSASSLRSSSLRNTSSRSATVSNTSTTRSAATSASDVPILRLGTKGPDVIKLQQRLQAVGLFQGSIDGDFGPQTETAVKVVQQRYGLQPDGVVGPATWNAISSKRRTR